MSGGNGKHHTSSRYYTAEICMVVQALRGVLAWPDFSLGLCALGVAARMCDKTVMMWWWNPQDCDWPGISLVKSGRHFRQLPCAQIELLSEHHLADWCPQAQDWKTVPIKFLKPQAHWLWGFWAKLCHCNFEVNFGHSLSMLDLGTSSNVGVSGEWCTDDSPASWIQQEGD